MKKIISILILFMLSLSIHAQKDITKFLGIPVDGTKEEMLRKIKAKGFTLVPGESDVLTGEFNGNNVYIRVGTNRNKVYRVYITNVLFYNEAEVKIAFNSLLTQFNNNRKYISLNNDLIPQDERISSELLIHKKRYEADFYQKTNITDTTIDNNLPFHKSVWFMIYKYGYDKYNILLYYDNLLNQANGDDL